ncbi:MAG: hypothetical protein IPK69_03675 [Phycisphaerales bacterium]|nr:MAG: hypothetical protein IPK69_03675 [Phycisphaerales bacterium]
MSTPTPHQSNTPAPAPEPKAAASKPAVLWVRPARLSMGVGLAVLAVAACAVMLNVLAEKFPKRWDLTATKSQALAPRTEKLLGRLSGNHEIILAHQFSTEVDPQARQRVADVLREFEMASPNVRSRWIDTNSSNGKAEYASLVADLVARDQQKLDNAKAAVEAANGMVAAGAKTLREGLAADLLEARNRISGSTQEDSQLRLQLEQAAGAAGVTATDLETAASSATDALAERTADIPLPETDKAAGVIRAAATLAASNLSGLARDLRALIASGKAAAGIEQLQSAATRSEHVRDQLSLAAEPLAHLIRPDVLRITAALRMGSVGLALGPESGSLIGIDLDALFPTTPWMNSTQASPVDVGRRAEELFASALSAIGGTPAPIVVFVHAEPRAYLDQFRFLDLLIQRLNTRGIDTVEWPCLLQESPQLPPTDPARPKPVVYVTIPPDATAPAGGPNEQPGQQRASKLAEVVSKLVVDNQRVLLSLNPSTLPTIGDKDPFAAILAQFGMSISSARPLMVETPTSGRGRLVEPGVLVQPPQGRHPISRAIAGLPTYLLWPLPIVRSENPPGDNVSIEPLIVQKAPQTNVWAESAWLQYYQARAEQRAMMPNKPEYNEGRDDRESPSGLSLLTRDWVLAAAAERETSKGPQRLVVVGSNGWFIDAVAQRAVTIDGRLVARNPGNTEFFEAAVAWLCNQDDSIAQSPISRTLPVVIPLTDQKLSILRWVLIAGMPGLILLLGIAYRVIRG